ncbi:hypothetical protein TWF281_001435 [Arthrobotrys megalospora]
MSSGHEDRKIVRNASAGGVHDHQAMRSRTLLQIEPIDWFATSAGAEVGCGYICSPAYARTPRITAPGEACDKRSVTRVMDL